MAASNVERQQAFHERHSSVSRQKCKDQDRRTSLEADVPAWLKHYFADAYELEFGKPHKDIIERGLYTIENGGNMVVAAPRGTGKSAVIWGLSLYAVATGKVDFPAVVPWESKATRRALRFWKNSLCFNERLAEDYPELCDPFVKSRGNSQRLVALLWSDNKKNTGARLSVAEGLIVLPDSRGVLGSTTINGNPRGLNHSTEDGQILRPDLVIIDDPQDKESAGSPEQVRQIIETIDADVLGMGGPGKKISALMACTVIKNGDVATHYLNHAEWDSIRIPQIVSWPHDMKAWDDWNEIRLEGQDNKDNGKAAVSYYISHRDAMIAGMEVSWDERFDKSKGQPDAYYAAMDDYFRMGDAAFYSERQNDPRESDTVLYTITPGLVASHTLQIPRLHLPATAHTFVGFIDINRVGLHYCLAGFDQMMTGHSPLYGKHPQQGDLWAKNAPELNRKQAIFKGLRDLCAQISATTFVRSDRRVQPSLMVIDCGYEPDVVFKFCAAASFPFRCIPSRGYAAHKYSVHRSTLIGRPMEGCHAVSSDAGQFIAFNADVWLETAQRAFLADPGAPGGFTLYDAPANYHIRFAEHVCAEKLANKYETQAGLRWEWVHRPGSFWDLGDALKGCYVAAAVCGLSASGEPAQSAKKTTRKAKVSMVSI